MSNTATTPAKRPQKAPVGGLDRPVTVRMLNEQRQEILEKLAEHRPEIDEGLKIARKHPGISKEVTKLHARWENLEKRVNEIDPEGAKNSPTRALLMKGELDVIRDKMSAFDTLSLMLTNVRTQAGKLEENQAVIVDQHNMLTGKHNGAVRRLRGVEWEQAAQRSSLRFWLVVTIIPLIVGFFVWLGYSNVHFTTTQKLKNGTTITYLNEYNQAYYAWFMAVLVTLLVAIAIGVVYAIAKSVQTRRAREQAESEGLASDKDIAETFNLDETTTAAESSTPDNLAPTKPIPAKGAMQGAR